MCYLVGTAGCEACTRSMVRRTSGDAATPAQDATPRCGMATRPVAPIGCSAWRRAAAAHCDTLRNAAACALCIRRGSPWHVSGGSGGRSLIISAAPTLPTLSAALAAASAGSCRIASYGMAPVGSSALAAGLRWPTAAEADGRRLEEIDRHVSSSCTHARTHSASVPHRSSGVHGSPADSVPNQPERQSLRSARHLVRCIVQP